jgi:hypothetical protein
VHAQSSGNGSTLFQGAASNGTTVAQLDDSGNLTIAGTLTQKGTLTTALRGGDGRYRTAYSAHSTSPVVDDVGEATLASGSGFVAIDGAQATSIDLTRGYLVFLTPQGATPGLYVSGKTSAGFTVREIGGADDSIPFYTGSWRVLTGNGTAFSADAANDPFRHDREAALLPAYPSITVQPRKARPHEFAQAVDVGVRLVRPAAELQRVSLNSR